MSETPRICRIITHVRQFKWTRCGLIWRRLAMVRVQEVSPFGLDLIGEPVVRFLPYSWRDKTHCFMDALRIPQ